MILTEHDVYNRRYNQVDFIKRTVCFSREKPFTSINITGEADQYFNIKTSFNKHKEESGFGLYEGLFLEKMSYL